MLPRMSNSKIYDTLVERGDIDNLSAIMKNSTESHTLHNTMLLFDDALSTFDEIIEIDGNGGITLVSDETSVRRFLLKGFRKHVIGNNDKHFPPFGEYSSEERIMDGLHNWAEHTVKWFDDLNNAGKAFMFLNSHPLSWRLMRDGRLKTDNGVVTSWSSVYSDSTFCIESGVFNYHDIDLDVYGGSWEECYLFLAINWLVWHDGAKLDTSDKKKEEVYRFVHDGEEPWWKH